MFYQQSDSYNRINSFLKCYWNVMTRLCVVRWFKIEETQSQKYWISTKLTPQWLSVHPSQTLLKRYLESWARTTWNQKTGGSICTNLKTFLKYPLYYGFQALSKPWLFIIQTWRVMNSGRSPLGFFP